MLWQLRVHLALLLVLIATIAVHADNVDDYIKTQMRWQHIPGLSLAVVRDGKIIKTQGYGLANIETKTPATSETVYKVASVSKQFLAAGIMLLVQEGKLGLDDPVRQYLDGGPESWKNITVRHLLTHTSGLAREAPGFDSLKSQPDADVIKAAYSLPLRFAPGERWAYSNVNYYCLAEVLHKVTGKSWSQFLDERLFAPLGMRTTRTTTMTDIVPHRASGYTSSEGGWVNAEVWLALRPSGAFLSTVTDFAKWDAALYSDVVLSDSSRAALWSPVRLNDGKTFGYGFGWFLDSFQGHRRVHHSGGVPGFVCEFERFLDDRLTVILMANVDNRNLEDVAVAVAAFYTPSLQLTVAPPLADAEPQFTAQVRAVIAGLTKGELAHGLFTSELEGNLTGELKAGAFKDLGSFGRIQTFRLIERKNEGGNRIYRYQLNYRNLPLFVDCAVGADGKIARFGLHD